MKQTELTPEQLAAAEAVARAAPPMSPDKRARRRALLDRQQRVRQRREAS